jgi:2-polyprenyl-3-methyl-5-hydroxy-6-metoxy-1,4-benzoquinol methylase
MLPQDDSAENKPVATDRDRTAVSIPPIPQWMRVTNREQTMQEGERVPLSVVNQQDYNSGSLSHGQRVAERVVLARGRGYVRRNEKFAQFLGLKPGQRVIEFGCGMGTMSLALAQYGVEIMATDISDGEVGLLRENAARLGVADRVQTAVGEPSTLPVAWHGSYDFALTSSVLHHVEDPSAFVGGMSNFVRPGGWCGGIEPNAESPWMRAVQELGFRLPGYVVGSREAERNFHTATAGNIAAYASQNRLDQIEITRCEFLPRPLISALPALAHVDSFLSGARILHPLLLTLFWKGMVSSDS